MCDEPDFPVFGDAVNLKDRLGQIQTHRDNLLHGTVLPLVCMNSTIPLVNVTAEAAPTSGQMLGGRMWY